MEQCKNQLSGETPDFPGTRENHLHMETRPRRGLTSQLLAGQRPYPCSPGHCLLTSVTAPLLNWGTVCRRPLS